MPNSSGPEFLTPVPQRREFSKSAVFGRLIVGFSALAAGVVIAVQLFESLTRDMCIDLRCGQVAVAQQHLHDPQIRATIQEMRGKCVPQAVW